MNGGKTGLGKKSNAMLGVGPGVASNGTMGGSTHGYGPIGGPGGYKGIISGGTNANQHNNINMNINVYKQGSNSSNSNQGNIKESISFSKINAKIKKR